MEYIALVLFVVVTSAHLYASHKTDRTWRNRTKPFILITLLAYYMLATDDLRLMIVLALIFSWLGDVLLMPHGVKWFTAGGISFMISHAFFIAGYCQDISIANVSWPVLIGMELFFLILVAYIFSKLKQHLPKPLVWPMFLYLFINGTMNCFAILRMLSNPCTATIITCIGAVLFFVSDTTLFFVRFNKDSRFRTHFWVMFTYSLGEMMIVLGLV